ncbi:ATP-binding protein [Megasphaera vaginalis (ex Srinivasan et al. 2021)]|uniref:ATPase, AAA family n=1 Tax=Megasphaera vaginalis (ex Srinivasan et al. 2021) TaxID=1111454 RepID=U7UU96_9FIRM|nr:ATP-binding protein [Megasphaera vaginalis (ex Srinivasan et al. 2021)]ERT62474.1 ATPase, AAA family [Megasphaera vaginalis (ex Srinivasan et al. 2021)]
METKKEENPVINFIPEKPRYTFDDIILPDYVRSRIMDVADSVRYGDIVFKTWGLGKTHKHAKSLGINLYGPSGTGKTMAAHAIADYLGRKLITINYAELESKFVGETPKNIKKAFYAATNTDSILFFDEADAILGHRVTHMASASDVSVNQTRSVMLMEMNEYEDFIIFATNFIESFDSAFMRRIPVHVRFDLPDEGQRKLLWRRYIPDEMPNDINIDALAHDYAGISGGDIANAVLMSAFKAARQHDSQVTEAYVREMIENAIAGKKANGAGRK